MEVLSSFRLLVTRKIQRRVETMVAYRVEAKMDRYIPDGYSVTDAWKMTAATIIAKGLVAPYFPKETDEELKRDEEDIAAQAARLQAAERPGTSWFSSADEDEKKEEGKSGGSWWGESEEEKRKREEEEKQKAEAGKSWFWGGESEEERKRKEEEEKRKEEAGKSWFWGGDNEEERKKKEEEERKKEAEGSWWFWGSGEKSAEEKEKEERKKKEAVESSNWSLFKWGDDDDDDEDGDDEVKEKKQEAESFLTRFFRDKEMEKPEEARLESEKLVGDYYNIVRAKAGKPDGYQEEEKGMFAVIENFYNTKD